MNVIYVFPLDVYLCVRHWGYISEFLHSCAALLQVSEYYYQRARGS